MTVMQQKIKSAWKLTLLKTGAFFRRQQWKEIFIFLFFLLLSFSFWFLQSLQQDYERRVELPLRYKNVPSEWVLSEKNPKIINILLKDKGGALIYYFWRSHFNPIDLSVSALPQSDNHTLHISRRVLETALSKQLIASTTIIAIEPSEIELQYDSLGSRTASIVADIQVITKPGFQISDSIRLSHAEVRLYGSNSLLDTLHEVRTRHITLDHVSKTREVTVGLQLPEGVRADHETVRLTIPVEEYTEKKIQLPVRCPDVPSGYALRMFPSIVEVVCDVPVSKFRNLTVDDMDIVMPFMEFKNNQATGKMPVRLTRKPGWVMRTVVVPDELEFIIEPLKHD
jgi:hypothetical protein